MFGNEQRFVLHTVPVDTVPTVDQLLNKPDPTEMEKMVLSALSMLSVSSTYHDCTLQQIYSRMAAGADVRIEFPFPENDN